MADEAPSEEKETRLFLKINAIRGDSNFQKHYDSIKMRIEDALQEWQREQCKKHQGNHAEIGRSVEMSEQMFELLDRLHNKDFTMEDTKRKKRPYLHNQHG